jgi:hypothetical protein
MRILWKTFFAGFAVALCTLSCDGNQQITPTITVQNDSTNHLDWVSVKWGDHRLDVGVMSPGTGATYLGVSLPTFVTTNVAIIKFINEDDPGLSSESGTPDEARARRVKSWRKVPVDVEPLLHLRPQHYDVTFRILSLTNAELQVNTTEKQ